MPGSDPRQGQGGRDGREQPPVDPRNQRPAYDRRPPGNDPRRQPPQGYRPQGPDGYRQPSPNDNRRSSPNDGRRPAPPHDYRQQQAPPNDYRQQPPNDPRRGPSPDARRTPPDPRQGRYPRYPDRGNRGAPGYPGGDDRTVVAGGDDRTVAARGQAAGVAGAVAGAAEARAWSEAADRRRVDGKAADRGRADEKGAGREAKPGRSGEPVGVAGYAPPQTPERFVDREQRSSGSAPPRPKKLPGRRAGTSGLPPGGRRPRRKLRLSGFPLRGGAVFLVVALVVGLIGSVVYFDSRLERADVFPQPRPADTAGTNWLLVGSDSRVGLTPEQEAELSTGGDLGSSRTDTIMLIHVPSGSGPTTMVSLPRDSYVSVPGYGEDKLNSAFAIGGANLLIQTIEQSTGLRIDRYAEIGFGGFAGIVDAVGGVNICVPYPIDDPLAGVNLAAGCQDLDGAQALGFVRSRATVLADVDRMNNQRMFLSALLSKATGWSTLANPWRMWKLASGVTGTLLVDNGTHLWNLARLGWAVRSDVATTTVPIGGFEDTSSGNALLWDEGRATEFFGYLQRDEPLPDSLITSTQ